MEREVRYCTSADGTRIAYTAFGKGPVLLACSAAWESIIDRNHWLRSAYEPVYAGRKVVSYFPRGVGSSQRNPVSFCHEAMVADLESVTDACGLERFALFASTFSVPWAIEYAARHADQVVRLILTRGAARPADVLPPQQVQGIVGLIRSNWDMGAQLLSDMGTREQNPEWGVPGATEFQKNTDGADVARWLEDIIASTDVTAVLREVRVPTLILHRKDDATIPFPFAEHLAAGIKDARLVALNGSGPISLGDDVANVTQAMKDFLDEDPETRAMPVAEQRTTVSVVSGFRAVVFTDLVGHTEMMSRLGDEAGRAVLRDHESIIRCVLKANGGTEVKTMGDGFMASFASVTRAVECAIALQRAFAEREGEPLSVRVGLNAGEPIEEDGDLFGATVILASRIAARAEGGEILVADAVRGLCSGKGFSFVDRGEFNAKGIDEPVRVSEVRWRE